MTEPKNIDLAPDGSPNAAGVMPSNGDLSAEVRMPDGRLMAKKDAPVGGQAVLEGVMMRGVSTWAVAVRLPAPAASEESSEESSPNGAAPDGQVDANAEVGPDGEPFGKIEVHTERFEPWMKRRRLFRLPLVRGVIALVESLKIGMRALGISANAQLDEPDEEISGRMWAATIAISLVFAIGLFFVLPVTVANIWKDEVGSSVAFVVLEKLIRISVFLLYLWAISKLRDLRRVFEYHGAEHKVISCYEADDELVPERAALYSRLHLRCGTSFLLIVMIVAVFVFAPIGRPALHWLILSRVLGFAVVAGVAYEIIRWAGRNRRKRWVRGLMWPGLQLQKLTTREPSLDQLAIGIAALEAVLEVEDPAKSTEEDRLGMEVVA
jgi:uncharacterized protein YqhQ